MPILWQSTLNRWSSVCSLRGLVRCGFLLLGPLLVTLALALILLCAYVYFTLLLPFWYRDPAASHLLYTAHKVLGVYLVVQCLFNYACAILVSPGSVDDAMVQKMTGLSSSDFRAALNERPDSIRERVCSKCCLPKPNRAHHCSVCQKCILKMDHHCPWIAGCVGHGNARYFYLFLIYLFISCVNLTIVAIPIFWKGWVQGDNEIWKQLITNDPRNPSAHLLTKALFLLVFLLAVAIGLAMGLFVMWNTFLICTSQTTIEYYINQDAKGDGRHSINEYDLGTKRNMKVFFNMGFAESPPWFYALLPIPVRAVGDGVTWLTVRNLSYSSSLADQQLLLTDVAV